MAQKILSYMPAPNVAPRAGQNPFYDNYVIPEPIKDNLSQCAGQVGLQPDLSRPLHAALRVLERRGAWNTNGLSGPAADAYPNGSRNSTFATEEVHTFYAEPGAGTFKAVVTTFIQINLGGAQGFDQTSLGCRRAWWVSTRASTTTSRASVSAASPSGKHGRQHQPLRAG